MPELSYDLTIATVCRNALNVLPRCISSVQPIYQTDLKVEHLLVDGASTDGSVAYLWCQQQAGRIARYISEADSGIYQAMNKAILLARGRVIVFINADDEICADAVGMCCAPILEGRADYVVASALCMGGRKKRVLRPRREMTLWRQPYCHQAMFCSRELLLRMDGFDAERFPIGADTDLMRRLYVMNIPCIEVPVIAARFYMGGVSSTPAAYRDVYELLLKFSDECCASVRFQPEIAGTVLRHLRRYANKKMMADSAYNLPGREAERLADFVCRIADSLPWYRRILIVIRVWFYHVWYMLLGICSAGKMRQKARLNTEICELFIHHI